MKVEFVVSLIRLVSVGLLNLLLVRLVAGDRLIRFDLFFESSLRRWRGGGLCGG